MSSKLHWSRGRSRVILLFLLFFKFIGLATFSLKTPTVPKKKCSGNVLVFFTGSKLGVFYNLIWSFLIIASNFITIPILNDIDYAFKTIITQIFEISQVLMGSFVISWILVFYCINEAAFVKVGNYIICLEGALCRLQKPLNWKHIFYVLFFIYLLLLGLFVALLITEIICFSNFISIIADILPITFMGFFFIQYFSLVTLTNAISVNVNCAIQDLGRAKFNNTAFDQARHMFISSSKIHLVVQIRDIHDQLYDISNEISRIYSLPTLVALPFTFYVLLYNVYYLFELIAVQNVAANFLILINSLLWIICILYPLGLLTFKITKATNEIQKTGNLVHTLLKYTIDRQIKEELEQFSLQLLHRKIKFTANGYFTLDNMFFKSILSTVITYMVILLQFQVGKSNTCPCNCTQSL
ncbi:putative gustatory receptor 28a [Frieseomelitta varia]|uniref:putative gustatory receptor 28a n=1 Tax=Frieseomelitta varia TaxID=561572 RepID=UPI001CB67CD6|nr:putative gustatory receptor 28a [Frieseomelitta varia]